MRLILGKAMNTLDSTAMMSTRSLARITPLGTANSPNWSAPRSTARTQDLRMVQLIYCTLMVVTYTKMFVTILNCGVQSYRRAQLSYFTTPMPMKMSLAFIASGKKWKLIFQILIFCMVMVSGFLVTARPNHQN